MPDLLLFISKTGFCFFIIPILCSRARQFVLSKPRIFDKIRHRVRDHKKTAEFAVFIDIAPDGAHTARALRLRARTSQRQSLPARRMTESARRCAVPSVGSRVYALLSSTMRVRDGVSVSLLVLFSSVRKAHIFLLWKGENACFSLQKEKHQKNCKPPA